jgi:hypothetical protein
MLVVALVGCQGTPPTPPPSPPGASSKPSPEPTRDRVQVTLPESASIAEMTHAIEAAAGVSGRQGCYFILGAEPLPGRPMRILAGTQAFDGRIYCGELVSEDEEPSEEAQRVSLEFKLGCCLLIAVSGDRMALFVPPGSTELNDELLKQLEEGAQAGIVLPREPIHPLLLILPEKENDWKRPRATAATFAHWARIARLLGPIKLQSLESAQSEESR